ncbi:hypothetical protein HMPREF1624_06116 [Sporothrix schenckii ATCC 58251]|uniref:FMN hydroxy acid dehydrogenase domain-containing protein n=1 Tax=Sporothrix schenckii (strain ATCC 58251 / de Perez 2211183) TaxID=1391915 RepID=U7PTA2_SPOS1|nr:hypothetical protein HMPREF1624_06116 [Sporothrix schenckii ATCC 58251]
MGKDTRHSAGTPHPPQPPIRDPPYADYLYDIYRSRLLASQLPVATTDPYALEDEARRVMSSEVKPNEDGEGAIPARPAAFGYIAGGAGAGTTVEANRRALDHVALVPRMMRPGKVKAGTDAATASLRDLRVRLFGGPGRGPPVDLASPVVMAPVGVQCAYHPDREVGVAGACAEVGVPFSISTASSSSIEEIKASLDDMCVEDSAGSPAPAPWYQLYWPQDDAITASLLQRARAAGCRVLLVTVDTFTIAWRPTDLDAGYLPFITTNEGNAIGFSDPVFRKKLAEGEPGAEDEEGDGDGESEPATPENNALAASLRWTSEVFPRRARPWSDLATLRRLWGDDGAILIKGVQHPDDALLARQYGADGVVVSNHGGRQVDGAVGSLEMLPEVVAAVRTAEARDAGEAERNGTGPLQPAPFTILFDSGIRTGSDVIKALCLGAQAVLVGRPVMYGLGIAGRDGAKHVLAGLLADLDQTMNLIGCATIADLGSFMLRKGGAAVKALL